MVRGAAIAGPSKVRTRNKLVLALLLAVGVGVSVGVRIALALTLILAYTDCSVVHPAPYTAPTACPVALSLCTEDACVPLTAICILGGTTPQYQIVALSARDGVCAVPVVASVQERASTAVVIDDLLLESCARVLVERATDPAKEK